MKKTLFSHTFCGTSCRKLKKRCSFAYFANFLQKCFELCTKCLEKREKNTVFSHILRVKKRSCKKLKKRSHFFQKKLFSRLFLRTLYKVSRKREKKTVFSHVLRDVVQKAQKTLSRKKFSRTLLKNVFSHEKREKTLLRDVVCKSSKNAVFFFAFFANFFVQSVSKNVKKHCFLTLFQRDVVQKAQKNAVFRIFCEHSTKCLEKREKTLFSHTFCAELFCLEKREKTLFSHTF